MSLLTIVFYMLSLAVLCSLSGVLEKKLVSIEWDHRRTHWNGSYGHEVILNLDPNRLSMLSYLCFLSTKCRKHIDRDYRTRK